MRRLALKFSLPLGSPTEGRAGAGRLAVIPVEVRSRRGQAPLEDCGDRSAPAYENTAPGGAGQAAPEGNGAMRVD